MGIKWYLIVLLMEVLGFYFWFTGAPFFKTFGTVYCKYIPGLFFAF